MASIGEIVKHRAGTQTNTIDEFTAASGVRVDGVLLKDAGVTASGGVSTNTITEFTSGSGVTVDGVLIKDGGITATGTNTINLTTISADTINETTSGSGVTVDGVLLKDAQVTASGASGIITNTITERTSASGVTIDGVLLKDAQVTASGASGIITNTITERTSASGVTIDSVLLKDGNVTTTASGTVTTTYIQSKDTQDFSFKNSSGTSTITITDAGAVTLGGSSFTGSHVFNSRKVSFAPGGMLRFGGAATVNNGATFTSSIPLNVDNGGGILVVSGYLNSTGAAFTWVAWAAIQVVGGTGTVTGAFVAGNVSNYFTLGSSGGFLTLTNGSGGQLTIQGCVLLGA